MFCVNAQIQNYNPPRYSSLKPSLVFLFSSFLIFNPSISSVTLTSKIHLKPFQLSCSHCVDSSPSHCHFSHGTTSAVQAKNNGGQVLCSLAPILFLAQGLPSVAKTCQVFCCLWTFVLAVFLCPWHCLTNAYGDVLSQAWHLQRGLLWLRESCLLFIVCIALRAHNYVTLLFIYLNNVFNVNLLLYNQTSQG